ncbi:MAG TPA: universal stress protein [Candidatus Acidoferrum sp.]|jgi:universal stress protein A|nr:universal stress protein [Candidatus Acidoferrum sp.]
MKRIVCPTDFSERAAPAERQAVRLARALGAELVLAHVGSEAPLWREGLYTPDVRAVFEGQRKWAADTLAVRAAELAAEGVATRSVVRVGEPAVEIVRLAAEEHADMIVMGTQGRTGLERLLLGSVAERVIRQAPCPVLTVRPDTDEQE